MPPASLSTLDVIMPGPTTARSSVSRRRRLRRRFCKFVPRPFSPSIPEVICLQLISPCRFPSYLFLHQPRYHVVHRDCSNGTFVLIHDGQHSQVVLVENLKHFF